MMIKWEDDEEERKEEWDMMVKLGGFDMIVFGLNFIMRS